MGKTANDKSLVSAETYAALSDEDRQLKKEALSQQKIFRFYASVQGSRRASERSEQARENWESAFVKRCGVLEKLRLSDQQRIARLERENLRLEDENETLRLDLKRLSREYQKKMGVAPQSMKTEKKSVRVTDHQDAGKGAVKRNRGAPKGHKGNTRRTPEKIDVEQIIPPPEICPCGGPILPSDAYDHKYIEDIPPVCKRVTLKKYQRGQCAKCGALFRHPAGVHGPPVEVGPELGVHLTVMRQMGVTYRKLSAFCSETLGIPLSASGVLGIINRISDQLHPVYTEIRQGVRNQEVLHGDETGWKVGKESWYIWCFCNKILAYFHPDKSRGSDVAKEILGEDFQGTLVCDFYGAYNFVDKLQRCLIHLLRDIHNERKLLPRSPSLEQLEQELMDFIDEGLRIQAMAQGPEKEKAYKKLVAKLDRIAGMKVPQGKPTTLVKRIKKHKDDLIRFVTDPQIEYHNNRAERQIRPLVVNRKTSFGSNTAAGALRTGIIHSVIETCRLNSMHPVPFLKKVLIDNNIPRLFDEPG